MTEAFLSKLASLPMGTFQGTADGRRYVVTRSTVAHGKDEKLLAQARDGSDYIYHLTSGSAVKPCEMPLAKGTAFVIELQPDPTVKS